jgi:putative polyhydroxyalkanoate system protein
MAIIDIKKEHTFSKDQARKFAESIAQDLKKQIPLKHGWQNDELHFEAKGAKGIISVHDTWLQIKINLPPLLSFFKSAIESGIHKHLNSMPKSLPLEMQNKQISQELNV